MRTPTASSMITISPVPMRVPPARMSMFSPAERIILITPPMLSSRISRTVMVLRSSSTSTSIATSPKHPSSSSAVMRPWLLLQIDGGLAQLVHRADHLGVGLVTALEHNQIRELFGDVHGGGFDRAS